MFDWIKKLLTRNKRSKIQEQLLFINTKMETTIIPLCNTAVDFYKENNLDTVETNSLEILKEIRKNPAFRSVKINNLPEAVLIACGNLSSKITLLADMIDKEFPNEFAGNAVTFKQAHILQLIDLFSFFVNYSSRILELSSFTDFSKIENEQTPHLSPGEMKYIVNGKKPYIRVLVILAESDATFDKLIEETSDYTIEEAGSAATYAGIQADPHQLGFMPIVGDAILMFREMYAEYVATIYDTDKARLASYQLRVERMRLEKQRLEGNDDKATLDRLQSLNKQIVYYNEKVKKLEIQLRNYERSLGL